MKTKFIVLVLGLFIVPNLALAEQEYKTSYLKFSSDILLNCVPTKLGTTICVATTPEHKENILVTFGSKLPGAKDNMKDYKTHLKRAQTNRTPAGKEFKSKISFLKETKIEDTNWIDALHKGGELENYFTRYLATVHNGVAVVFAVTIVEEKYKNYSLWLKKLVNSLRVLAVATKDKTNQLQKEEAPKLPNKEEVKS